MEYPLTYAQYQQGLSEGRLLGLLCQSCGAYTFPPLGVCRACGGRELNPAEIESRGFIRTFTVIRVAPEGIQPPYIIVMVELVQGSWVIGRLISLEVEQADMELVGKKVRLEIQPLKETGSDDEPIILNFTLT
jgi:uncharacterized OB-fold protein